jgi:hypothetical protein
MAIEQMKSLVDSAAAKRLNDSFAPTALPESTDTGKSEKP